MEFTPEERAAIQKEALAIAVVKRGYRNYNFHMHRFGRFLAQAETDQVALENANYDWTRFHRANAIQTMINEVHAKRVAAEGKRSAPDEQFHTLLLKMKTKRKALIIVLDYIEKRHPDSKLKAAAEKIKKGSTNIDIVRDVSSLAELLKEYLDLAAGIKPGGNEINEEYLNTAYAEAQEALNLDGKADQTESERGQLVDLQKRLLMLSMDAITEIKEFAKAAFYMDTDYYREHYTYSDNGKHETHDEDDHHLDLLDPEAPLTNDETTE